MGLATHANVYNTCLRILRDRGFELMISGDRLRHDVSYPVEVYWVAQKDGWRFSADNPIELLGLVAIYDYKQPREEQSYWWHVDGPDIWTELMDSAFPKRPPKDGKPTTEG